MILDQITAEVSSQLDDQAKLGVQVREQNEVPETGPSNGGLWLEIPAVTAVFADLNRSTELVAACGARSAAVAYTYFLRAMTVILERFSARYVDIQGDGIFGLFSGSEAPFLAVASAITMRSQIERDVAVRFKRDTATNWNLTAGIGIDEGTLLVRRLGLRGTKQNEVWAGKPVNIAAKLSSLGASNQVVVSDRTFSRYLQASGYRKWALTGSCGCQPGIGFYGNWRSGLDSPYGFMASPWTTEPVPWNQGFDFRQLHRLKDGWCETHGAEYCETIVTGQRPRN